MKKTFKEFIKSNLIHSFYKELSPSKVQEIMESHTPFKMRTKKVIENNSIDLKNSLDNFINNYEKFSEIDKKYFDGIIIEEID
jgi:homoserine trans-succinylase